MASHTLSKKSIAKVLDFNSKMYSGNQILIDLKGVLSQSPDIEELHYLIGEFGNITSKLDEYFTSHYPPPPDPQSEDL